MQVRGKRNTVIPWLIISVLLLITFALPAAASAADTAPVRLAVQPGLSGIYKLGLPAWLTITISNQDEAFKGLLVVEPVDNFPERPSQSTRYQKTVKVPARSLVTTTLMVPSELVNNGARAVLLVDGTPVAASSVQGTAVNGGFIALSLGEKPLKGGVSAWLDQTFGGQTAIKFLPPAYLPGDPLELSVADIIIVDDVSVARLSKEQIRLLKDWVSLGGMLLISGGAGTSPGGPLTELSPVTAAGRQVVSADLGGLRVVKGTMAVTTGPLTDGEVLARVNGVIVVAARDYGKGRVVYSGIPLENLTSESAAIWPLVFGQIYGPNSLDGKMREKRQYNNDMLGHAATYLPQLKTPPVPRVAVAWVIYVLVVGPGLYLLLRRYDRRDWMWWMIPVGAVITAGVVYFMSPAQRIHAPISQTLAVVEIMDSERAEVNATAAFISPYGGTLNVEGSPGAVLWPSNNYYSPRQKSPIIQYDAEAGPRISFPDVEYWSMRQARATAIKHDVGQISGSLVLENGYIKGEIANHTKMDLRDCRILLGGRSIALNRIPAGGSVEVNQSLAKGPGSLGPNEFRDLLVPPVRPGENDIYVRERQMVDVVLGPRMNDPGNQPVFFGWTDDSLGMFKILSNQKNVRDYNLALVTQELQLHLPIGKVVQLAPGMYMPKVIESRGAFNQTPLGYTLYEGKITLGIDLLRPLNNRNFKVVSIEFPPQENKNVAMRIYDWQEEKWIDVPSSGLKIGPEKLKRYGSPSGECRFQVEKTTGLGRPDKVDLPAVAVEGVVSR
ncbi:hypothetical protein [Desulforamulus putei]|uniref:hypothetical protein n=1 Tax=Desulforamulus putei TaxID=74701 RepID=UPI002FDCCDBE